MRIVQVAGAIASKMGLTLYLEDGETMELSNANWNTGEILAQMMPALSNRKTFSLNLDRPSPEKMVEEKSGGAITFIKRKISMFGKLFTKAKSEMEIRDGTPQGVIVGLKPVMKDLPMPFERKPEETIVAVVDGKMIPGMEVIQTHIAHAAATGTKGLEEFLRRISKIEGKRKHTAQELLNFLKRADLPFAEDGSIIAYKVLKTYDSGAAKFVDCHSGRVKQHLGSHVSMNESLVDMNRREECSAGLHIARRGYLSGFSGDVITIVKINPEDVIAVPFGDPDKMRVAAYHIVAVLPARVHQLLRSNKAMTDDPEAAQILGNVLAGNHVAVLEYVKIGAANGGDVTVTPAEGYKPDAVAAPALIKVEAKAVTETGDVNFAEVDPTAIARKVEELRDKTVDNVVQIAALTGDLSAALVPEPKKRTTVVKKLKKSVAAAPTAPAEKPASSIGMTEDRDKKILDLHKAGVNPRQIERDTGIPRTTIRRVIAKNT